MSDTNKTFKIPACNLETFNAKIEKLNRKAVKLGVAQITTKVTGVEIQEIRTFVGYDEQNIPVFHRSQMRFYSLEVEGVAVRLEGGWTFVGTLEHTDAGNITRALPGQTMPEAFRTASKTCSHCGKARNRKDTYIVRDEAGEYKQVGKQCVRDYLGHASPEHLAWLATLIKEAEEMGRDTSGMEDKGRDIMDLMETGAEVVLRHGYVSKTAAQAYAVKVSESEGTGGIAPTSVRTWAQLNPTQEMIRDGGVYPISDEAKALGAAALEFAKTFKGDSDYAYNLRTIAQKQYIGKRDVALLVSAIGGYQKAQGYERERKARTADFAKSQHFGTVEKREVFALTVIGEHVIGAGQFYGAEDRVLYRMQDAQGNVAVWFTSGLKLDIGKTYTIKATVKEHSVYKDIKQTVLTRCAVVEEKQKADTLSDTGLDASQAET